MRISVQVFDTPAGGEGIADWSSNFFDAVLVTGRHGFLSFDFKVSMSIRQAFKFYGRQGQMHIVVSWGGFCIWEGRIEDVGIIDGGISVKALGYWSAFFDLPYTAVWADAGLDEWQEVTGDGWANALPDIFEIDNNDRLYIAARNGDTFDDTKRGVLAYAIPHNSERPLVEIDFNYDMNGSSSWKAQLYSFKGDLVDGDWDWLADEWSLTGTGSQQTGTVTQTLAGAPDDITGVGFALFYNSGTPAAYSGNTGDTYLKITGVQVRSTSSNTVYANEIAQALCSWINGINGTIKTDAAMIFSPGLAIDTAVFQDRFPGDILIDMASQGDDQSPPRKWEAGVWEDARLFFRPAGAYNRSWYALIDDPFELERSLGDVRNSAYATYNGFRTAVAQDLNSIARTGLERRAAVSASTTNQTRAEAHRDIYLIDNAAPSPKATISLSALLDENYNPARNWEVRGGDTVTITNLPPELQALDKIRTFTIDRTNLRLDTNYFSFSPQALSSLEFFIARGSL